MRSKRILALVTGVAAIAIGIYAETTGSADKNRSSNDPVSIAVDKGLKWLVSAQGKDGGWGQDGGETSYVRQGEHLESNGNDVANTAVAAQTLLHTRTTRTRGAHRKTARRTQSRSKPLLPSLRIRALSPVSDRSAVRNSFRI